MPGLRAGAGSRPCGTGDGQSPAVGEVADPEVAEAVAHGRGFRNLLRRNDQPHLPVDRDVGRMEHPVGAAELETLDAHQTVEPVFSVVQRNDRLAVGKLRGTETGTVAMDGLLSVGPVQGHAGQPVTDVVLVRRMDVAPLVGLDQIGSSRPCRCSGSRPEPGTAPRAGKPKGRCPSS